jgi:4-amino-4-deoxy-L-arabinose transferase-like glycosyltransferase
MKKLLFRLWAAAQQPQALTWVILGTGFWLGCLSWVRHLHLPDEGRYVGVAFDMARADSFSVPLLNGLPYFHKPPLFYWLNEIAFMLFGANDWSARIPSWLAAWACAIGLYLFIRKYRDVATATVTLAVLLTMPYFYGGAQYANLDMLVASMMSLTVLAGADAVLRSEHGQAYRLVAVVAAICAALAVLSKGLIGVVLPGGVLFFWLMLTGRWRKLGVLLWPPAVLAFLVVAVPWFWLMQQRFPDFFNYYFIHQQVERFVGEAFNNPQPVWFYLPVILGMTLPWSLALPGVFFRSFWKSDAAGLGILMVIWFLVVAIFFSIPASKLIGYALPTLPPLAVLLAEVLIRVMRRYSASPVIRLVLGCFLGAMVGCLIAIGVFRYIQRDSGYEMGNYIVAQKSPEDTLIYLMNYPFDLAFYSAMNKPAWIVENWPKLPVRDNWRNELLDAGNFDPELAKQTLVNLESLMPRLCATENKVFWVRGDSYMSDYWPFLKNNTPAFVQPNGGTLWKVTTHPDFKAEFCKG